MICCFAKNIVCNLGTIWAHVEAILRIGGEEEYESVAGQKRTEKKSVILMKLLNNIKLGRSWWIYKPNTDLQKMLCPFRLSPINWMGKCKHAPSDLVRSFIFILFN